ncbi:MAG: hemerythrin family protein [Synergistaceae bacterium]|nr:hemerythrin family protein [Synergistaceae bacterium]
MLWSAALETGMKEVDDQHKELFRQIDTLLDAGNANRFREVLDFLDGYIVKHFTDEQKLHARSKYPKASEHKAYHDNYVVIFRKLKAKYIAEGPSAVNNMEINKSVAGWLKEHILVHDREFAAYYKSL